MDHVPITGRVVSGKMVREDQPDPMSEEFWITTLNGQEWRVAKVEGWDFGITSN